MELNIRISPQKAKRFGIKVFCSPDGREETPIAVDLESQTVTIQLDKTGRTSEQYKSFFLYRSDNPDVSAQCAPIDVEPGKEIHLRVFLDKSVLEVFVNDSQCVSQLVYPSFPESQRIAVYSDDGEIEVLSLQSWHMFPANQW